MSPVYEEDEFLGWNFWPGMIKARNDDEPSEQLWRRHRTATSQGQRIAVHAAQEMAVGRRYRLRRRANRPTDLLPDAEHNADRVRCAVEPASALVVSRPW